MLGCSGACDPPKRSGKKEKGWRIKHHQKHHGGGQRRLKEGEGDNEKGKDMYVERCHEDASLLGSTCESNHSSSNYHKFSASSQDGDSDSRDSGHEDDFESLRNSSYTVSSNDSSMFPLLDNMTEVTVAICMLRRSLHLNIFQLTHINLYPSYPMIPPNFILLLNSRTIWPGR